MCLIAGIMLNNISIRELHAIVIRNFGRLTLSRKTSANVFKLDASKQGTQPGKLYHFGNHPQMTCFKTRASRGNHGNLTHQSPRENMHKLFDCIRTPLKRFLACLIFHRKEVRLSHLHKRKNTGSAPESINH